MSILRSLALVPVSFILSFGLVIIASDFQLFSYARFSRLALYLMPMVYVVILALSYRFPPPPGWTKSRYFRREAVWVAGFASVLSLALIPVYEGWTRYLITFVTILSTLFLWGTFSALPEISKETRYAAPVQANQVAKGNHEAYSGRTNSIEIILIVFFILAGIIGMGIFLYMALYARMYGDDWCYHQNALFNGVIAASIDFYMTWSGRFFSNFLLFAGAGNRWTPMFQLILGVCSIFTCSYLALSPLSFGSRSTRFYPLLRILWSLGCAFFIPFLVFSITPDPYKSLYWIVSSVVVLPFLILFPVYLVFAKQVLTGNRKNDLSPFSRTRLVGYAAFGFLLGFILSTIHEVATVPVLILSSFLFSLALFSKARKVDGNVRNAAIILGFTLAGSLLGLIVTFFSPGNTTRHIIQGYPQPPDVFPLLLLNTRFFFNFLVRISLGATFSATRSVWEFGGVTWFALIAAFTLGYLGARPGYSGWNPLVVLALTLVMTWASFLPGTYAAQVEIPMRAELIPTVILVIGSFSAGFLSPKLPSGYLLVAILSIVLLLSTFIIKDFINMRLALVKPMVEYAGKWDVRHARLITTDEEIYSIKPPWDDREQGKDCMIIYYNNRRQGVFDDH